MRQHERHNPQVQPHVLQAMLSRGSPNGWLQEIPVKKMRHDLLSDVLYVMNNAEKIGRNTCTVPASKLVKNVLKVLQKEKYVGNFEFIDDGKSGHFTIELIGRINVSRSIKPRFFIKKGDFEKWETRYLPSKGFGILVISTSNGVMSHSEAVGIGIGGRLLGYVY